MDPNGLGKQFKKSEYFFQMGEKDNYCDFKGRGVFLCIYVHMTLCICVHCF